MVENVVTGAPLIRVGCYIPINEGRGNRIRVLGMGRSDPPDYSR